MPKYTKSGLYQADLYEFYASKHLHHVGNDYYHGMPFLLEKWQREQMWRPLLASGKMERGRFRRKYRRALFGLPRDYGKTEFSCALMLTVANMEPVYNGQYGIIASSKEQAQKILNTLKSMVAMDTDLKSLWEPLKGEVRNRETNAVVQVFPYKEAAVQSWHFNFILMDELHVWKDDTVWGALLSGQKSIPNALAVGITTADSSRSGFLWDLRERLSSDEGAYVWWHGAKDGERADDRRMWERIALPSWVSVEDIEDQYNTLTRAAFDRYVLNRFPTERTADRSMKGADLAACKRIPSGFDMERPFTLAVDGAVSGDAFAIVAHQVDGDGIDQFRCWIYDEPGERGYYELNQIEQLIAGICQKYRCPVGIDPARLLLMATQLQDVYGVEIYEIRQSNANMCPACGLLTSAVREHNVALGGLDKLAEHMANCRDLEREPYGVRYTSARHGQGTERIDGAIAAAMAKWMTAMLPRVESFAESGGVWSV